MAAKRFSFFTLVATALVSFIVTGIGGAMLAEWLDRPKPLLTISALGFAGTEEPVAIPDELRIATKESPWLKNYRKFESFEILLEDYKKAKHLKFRLERGQSLIKDWLKSNEPVFKNGRRLTLEELDSTPYMQDEIIGSSLIGMARRGEVASVPVGLDSLKSAEPVTELAELSDKYLLYMKDKNVGFPFGDARTSTEKRQIEQLAYSFSSGHGNNIIYYMKRVDDASNSEIRQLVSLLELLEESMHPFTTLSVRAEIFNSGRKPLIVKPYAHLWVTNDDIEQKVHLLKLSSLGFAEAEPESVGILEALTKMQLRGGSGSDIVVQGFFPSIEDRNYVLVRPGDSISLRLASNAPLGSSGRRLRTIFDASVLRAKLVVATDAGHQIHSPAMIFGATANADVERELSRGK